MKTWVKHEDPNNKYSGKYTLGNREVDLPHTAVISVTRGEGFNIIRLMINGILNEFVKKQLMKNTNIIYSELSGQLQGGISQTVTIWADGSLMNEFRTRGAHKFAVKFFSWVFLSGKVQAYFLTWKIGNKIPSDHEIEETIKEYGRHFDGGKMVRSAKQPPRFQK